MSTLMIVAMIYLAGAIALILFRGRRIKARKPWSLYMIGERITDSEIEKAKQNNVKVGLAWPAWVLGNILWGIIYVLWIASE